MHYLYEFSPSSDIINDENPIQVAYNVSAESCAARCSLASECSSFNFCDGSVNGTDKLCIFSTKHPQDQEVETTKIDGWKSYSKENPQTKPDPSPKPKPQPDPTTTSNSDLESGYMSGGKFTGIIFAMIFTGLIVGAVGQFGWNKWRGRREAVGGLGVDVPSVRWTRQRDEAE